MTSVSKPVRYIYRHKVSANLYGDGKNKRSVLSDESLKFIHERIYILELPVYGRKSYICDRIEIFKLLHNDLTDDAGRNLLILKCGDLIFYLVDKLCYLGCTDGSLMTGAEYAGFDLGTVILLSVIILLDDNERDGLNLLICSETLAAVITDPAPSDGIIIIGRSGINNSRIITSAIWTLHSALLIKDYAP